MSKPDSNKKTITFYLRIDLVEQLDKAAESVHMSRSQFLEWLLEKSFPLVTQVAAVIDGIFSKPRTKGIDEKLELKKY